MEASAGPRVPVIDLDGAPGLHRLSRRGRFTVPDAAAFTASWRSATVDGVQLGEWATSPISGAQSAALDAPAVVLLRVVSGSVRYWHGGAAVHAPAGSIHLMHRSDDVRFAVPEPSRFTRVIVPASLLPADIRHATALALGPTAPTRITAGLAALVDEVLDPEVGGSESAAAAAILPLAVAVIEDALPSTPEPDLLTRMIHHIEQRISDPDLGPRSIAAEFRVSLRWVHAVFDVDGTTVARHIRQRRLDHVAGRLRERHDVPRIGALAEAFGFASRDQLTRSFKARYGVTVADYATLAATGRAPAPVDGQDAAD